MDRGAEKPLAQCAFNFNLFPYCTNLHQTDCKKGGIKTVSYDTIVFNIVASKLFAYRKHSLIIVSLLVVIFKEVRHYVLKAIGSRAIDHVIEIGLGRSMCNLRNTISANFYRIPPPPLLYRFTDVVGKILGHLGYTMFFSPMIYDSGYSINPYFTMTFEPYLLFLFIKFYSTEVLHVLI